MWILVVGLPNCSCILLGRLIYLLRKSVFSVFYFFLKVSILSTLEFVLLLGYSQCSYTYLFKNFKNVMLCHTFSRE